MLGTFDRQNRGRDVARLGVIGLLMLAVYVCIGMPVDAAVVDRGSVMHVVEKGETLWGIGTQYGVTVEQLIRLNEMSEPDRLVVGQKLVVRQGEAKIHIVQRGETLTKIARQYGVRSHDLIALNELTTPDLLSIGQQLIIVPRWQRTHRVVAGDTLWDIAREYEVSVGAIRAANSLDDPSLLSIGKELVIPSVGGGDFGPAVPVLGRVTMGGPMMAWPVEGRITSGYGQRWGRMHYGLDIAAPIGTPVRAALAGTVTYSDWAGTYGMLVTIDHGGGVETRYAHNSGLLVKVGDRVQQGQRIALVGTTGESTGPHLHFEIVENGDRRDPITRLPPR